MEVYDLLLAFGAYYELSNDYLSIAAVSATHHE
jgi:hypothetical protein